MKAWLTKNLKKLLRYFGWVEKEPTPEPTPVPTPAPTPEPGPAPGDDRVPSPLPSFAHGSRVRVSVPSHENPADIAVSDYRQDGFLWQMERGCELAAQSALSKLRRAAVPLTVLGTVTKVLAYWSATGRGAKCISQETGQELEVAVSSHHECHLAAPDGTLYRLVYSYDHNRDTLPATKGPHGQTCKPGNYWFGTGQAWVQLDQYGGDQRVCEAWAIRRPYRALHMGQLSGEEQTAVMRGRGN